MSLFACVLIALTEPYFYDSYSGVCDNSGVTASHRERNKLLVESASNEVVSASSLLVA